METGVTLHYRCITYLLESAKGRCSRRKDVGRCQMLPNENGVARSGLPKGEVDA